MSILEQSRYYFNSVLPNIILSNVEQVNNFLSQFWWFFIFLALILFFVSITFFRKNLNLNLLFQEFDEFLKVIASKRDIKQIEDHILKSTKLLKARYLAIYELRGETYIIVESDLAKKTNVAAPFRIGKKDLIRFKNSGNFLVQYFVSNNEKYMLLFFSLKKISIEKHHGHFDIMLSYYDAISNNLKAEGGGALLNVSKNTSISLMKLQMDKYQFFKFFVALIMKITKAKGAKLFTQKNELVFEYSSGESVSLQKVFYIRNTPYRLEFYDNSLLDIKKMGQVGSFLDMAGAFLVNIDKNSEMVQNYLSLLNFTNQAIELESENYKNHSTIVQTISVEVAKSLFLSENEIDAISLGAYLHDIGMVGDLSAILDKNELEEKEINLMKEHPLIGSIMVEPICHIYPIANIIKYHHERFDGRGYPFGLKESQIPINAQIVALGEFYAGVTGERAYRKGKNHTEATEEIKKMRAKMFNPMVVDAFSDIEKSLETKINKIKAKENKNEK